MTLPESGVVLAWVGRSVVDRAGVELGVCTAVVAGQAHPAEWLLVDVAGRPALVPVLDAVESGNVLRVGVSGGDVADAPHMPDGRRVSDEQGEALYRHYRIEWPPAEGTAGVGRTRSRSRARQGLVLLAVVAGVAALAASLAGGAAAVLSRRWLHRRGIRLRSLPRAARSSAARLLRRRRRDRLAGAVRRLRRTTRIPLVAVRAGGRPASRAAEAARDRALRTAVKAGSSRGRSAAAERRAGYGARASARSVPLPRARRRRRLFSRFRRAALLLVAGYALGSRAGR